MIGTLKPLPGIDVFRKVVRGFLRYLNGLHSLSLHLFNDRYEIICIYLHLCAG
jgi:hypothetical protein